MDKPLIWGQGEAEYFCDDDWTGQISLIGQEIFGPPLIGKCGEDPAGRPAQKSKASLGGEPPLAYLATEAGLAQLRRH
jgi:hypothetical protein